MADKPHLPPEIEKYHEKWKRDPQSRVFAQLADAYRKHGMLDEAVEVCLEGLRSHPAYGSARMVLARAYLEKGMKREAEQELCEVLKGDPDNIPGNRLLGDLLQQEGRIPQAVECYQRIAKLTPLDREIKEILERTDQSLRGASGTSTTVPQPGKDEMTAASEEGGTADETVGDSMLQASPRAPDKDQDAFLTETIADLYLRQGLHEKAVGIFSKMLDADPSNLHVQQRLSEAIRLRDSQNPDPALLEEMAGLEKYLPELLQPNVPPGAEMEEGTPAPETAEVTVLAMEEADRTSQHGGGRSPAASRVSSEPTQVLQSWLTAIRQMRKVGRENGLL